MRSKNSFKKEFGVEVGTLTNDRRHYFLAEHSRKNLDLFKFFDAIYADIGWNLNRVVPETVIPVVHSKKEKDDEFYVFDLDVDASLSDRHSVKQLLSDEAISALAKTLGQKDLEFYYSCDDGKEMDRRIQKCDRLTFYHYGRIVFEADWNEDHGTWSPFYLYADSNVLAGMQPFIKCMLQ